MRSFAGAIGIVLATSAAAFGQDGNPPSDGETSAPPAEIAEEVLETEAKPTARRTAPPEVFREGLSAFYDADLVRAAARMHDYVSTNEVGTENRAWAQYFLGVSLARLGFTHGAAEHLFDVANDRTRPEILPDALTAIAQLMGGPHDEALLERRLIVDTDFGYLPPQVAGFVRYHQGLADLRERRTRWAERLFASIPDDSPYSARAEYALGVAELKARRDAKAVRRFRAALAHPAADRTVKNDARLALARVLYEARRYEAAEVMYRRVDVPELSTAEGTVLLERAWTAYWRGDFRTSMGLLYALEAPSYAELHLPEKFLLRALIYQKLCHYIPAKRAVRRFRYAYRPTLEHIRSRADLRASPELRRAARGLDPALARMFAYRRALADEAARIDDVGGSWRDVGLDDALRQVYELASRRTDLALDAQLEVAARQAAESLVEFEEQMNLLDYEVGLSIYRRLREEQARRRTDERIEIPLGGPDAIYPFVDEFWNDELADFDFLITSRCFDDGGPS